MTKSTCCGAEVKVNEDKFTGLFSFKTNYCTKCDKPCDVKEPICEHEYITDADWKSLTCRKCNHRIKPTKL